MERKRSFFGKRLLSLTMMVVLSLSALAETLGDTIPYTIIDGLKVPLVERKYVANSAFVDNWYVGLYGGVTSNWGSDASHAGFFQVMGPAAAITVGKEITPISAVRLQINYIRNTGVTDNQFPEGFLYMNHDRYKWNSYGLNAEYLLNLTNLIMGFREHRAFHLQAVVGIGGSVSRNYTTEKYATAQDIDNSHTRQLVNEDKYNNRQHSLVNLRAGVAGTFMVARNWNLHVEAMANILDNSYDSNPTTKNIWDGHIDFLVGASYRFNNKGGKAPGFYYPRHDMDVYKRKLAEIDAIRDKTRKRREELEAMTDTIAVDAKVMYTLIAFDDGETTVDRLQQTNIYTTAYAWVKSPQSFIYITNSSGVDDRLFRRRAAAILEILLERYEIPKDMIKIVPNEKDIKPIGDYIEFIVND